MSCYLCAEQFKFFKKEVGCGNCGFNFCSKCCNKKVAVPKKDNKALPVCHKCYEILTSKKDADKQDTHQQQQKLRDYSPPKALLKLAESNISKSNPPVDPNKNLVDRLEKLYDSDQKLNSIPTEDEIEKRLRQLQGVNLNSEKLSNLPSKDKIVTSEDLIKKFQEEAQISKIHEEFERNELEKLENRLKNLKSSNLLSESKPTNESDLNSDINSADVVGPKIDPVEEMYRKMLNTEEKKQKIQKDDDEDLWCILCNGDADLKCIDCDNDLYCKRCFKLTHQDNREYKNHRKSNLN